MKSHLVLGILTMALASGAAQAADDDKKNQKDNNRVICKNMTETGSRLARKRVCMSREQMEEQRLINRDIIQRNQGARPSGGNGG